MKLIGSFTKKDNATNNLITTATALDTETLRSSCDTSARIDLIKELRSFSGIGLSDAKLAVDKALDWNNETNTSNINNRNERFMAIENLFSSMPTSKPSKNLSPLKLSLSNKC